MKAKLTLLSLLLMAIGLSSCDSSYTENYSSEGAILMPKADCGGERCL